MEDDLINNDGPVVFLYCDIPRFAMEASIRRDDGEHDESTITTITTGRLHQKMVEKQAKTSGDGVPSFFAYGKLCALSFLSEGDDPSSSPSSVSQTSAAAALRLFFFSCAAASRSSKKSSSQKSAGVSLGS